MRKIFLYAYDRINLGDDLFIRTICNRYPNVKFYLWSKKYNEKVFDDVKNLKVLDKNSKYLTFYIRFICLFILDTNLGWKKDVML